MPRPTGVIERVGDHRYLLDGPAGRREVFFEIERYDSVNDDRMDSILVGSLLFWIRHDVEQIEVRGSVSRTLLRNLDELQLVWSRWRPDRYRAITFIPEAITDDEPSGTGAISAFSGGVDATFIVHRHLRHGDADSAFPLAELMMVHGFDVPLDEHAVFDRAVERAKRIVDGLDLPVTRVRTNLRDALKQELTDSFGLQVSSALLLFQKERRWGLIGSSEPCESVVIPWGSTPIQDWMASSGQMEIRHDGAGFSRTDKISAIADWKEARENLRVCWQGSEHDRNCGRCEKCIRTNLNFLAAGHEAPECFDRIPTTDEIRSVPLPNQRVLTEFRLLVDQARSHGITDKWVDAAMVAVRRNQRRQSIRNTARRVRRAASPRTRTKAGR